MNQKLVFVLSVPANVSQGFVAYGTTSYGYADFDNLYIDAIPVQARVDYFDHTYLSFYNRL